MKGYTIVLMVIVSVYCNDRRKDIQDYDKPEVVVGFDENNNVFRMQIDRNTGVLSNLTQTAIDSSNYKISFAKSLRDKIWVGCFKKDPTASDWDNSTLFMFQYDQNLKRFADIDLSSSGVKYTTNMLDVGYTSNSREKKSDASASSDSKNFVYVYEKSLSKNWYQSVNEDKIFAFQYTEEETKPQMTLVKVLPARQFWDGQIDSFSLVRILDGYSCTDVCYHSITIHGRVSRHFNAFFYETIKFNIQLKDATWDSFDYQKDDGFKQNGNMTYQLHDVMDMQSVFNDVEMFKKALDDLSKQFPNDSGSVVSNLKDSKMLQNKESVM